MQAGLVAGFIAMGKAPGAIVGYTVLAPLEKALATTFEKTQKTLELLNPDLSVPADAVAIRGEQLGSGYGLPTAAMREALSLAATFEGLLLDPVYSAKAFAGLIHEIRAGVLQPKHNALFVVSGGTPSLFAYRWALQ